MKENEEEIESNLIELLYFYRTKLVMMIIASAVGASAAGLFTHYLITPKYTATSKLYMVSASSDSIVNLTDLNLGTSLSSDYRELLKIRPIFEEIIEEEGLEDTYEDLLKMVTVSTLNDTRILVISVESTKPSQAMAIANALAEKAVTKLPELMETSEPNIAEQAILPQEKSSPSLTLNTLAGALAAVVFELGILTIRFVMDDTLNTAEEVEKSLGIMPLTVIPEGAVDSISDKSKKVRRNRCRRR